MITAFANAALSTHAQSRVAHGTHTRTQDKKIYVCCCFFSECGTTLPVAYIAVHRSAGIHLNMEPFKERQQTKCQICQFRSDIIVKIH